MKLLTTEERFWSKVDKNGPIPSNRPELGNCWIWTGAFTRAYGAFRDEQSRMVKAHVWAFGGKPGGFVLDHLCRTPACVRKTHLELVTPAENTLRGVSVSAVNAAKTHCPKGHPYDLLNTRQYASATKRTRVCRICERERAQRDRDKARLLTEVGS